MRLLVDIPKIYGNTKDGNTTRRFFSDTELASAITGIDITFFERFKIILEVIIHILGLRRKIYIHHGHRKTLRTIVLLATHVANCS